MNDPNQNPSGAATTTLLLQRMQELWQQVGGARMTGGHEGGGYSYSDELPRARIWPNAAVDVKEWCQPLNTPRWTAAGTAGHMRPDDPICAMVIRGQPVALPWWILKNHHVANLTIAGWPIVITFCEMCSSATGYWAVAVDTPGQYEEEPPPGERSLFRLRGQYNGTILVSDDATGSLWEPFTGRALAGALAGKALVQLPLWQCTWQEWLAEHPASLVAVEDEFSFQVTLERPLDDRLPFNTLVLGVTTTQAAQAYPLRWLSRAGAVVEDEIGQTPVVIFHRPGTLSAVAFDRRLGDRALRFASSDGQTMFDLETGSRWSPQGQAVAGPLVGARLRFVPSAVEEWFAFAAAHPGAGIWKLEEPS
jgi:hypothetical protein